MSLPGVVGRSDVVLAAIPAVALASPVARTLARALEASVDVGGSVAALPLIEVALVATLAVVVAATFAVPTDGHRSAGS